MGVLEGRTALVTGGGTGIGRGVAERLAAEGAFVFVCGRRAAALNEARAGIAAAIGRDGRVAVIAADVTREDDVRAAAKAVADRGQGLDVLVNCAGMMRFGRLDAVDPAGMRAMFDVNAFAPWRMSVAALPLLRRRGGGAIVNIASISGIRPFEGSGAYGMSKAALVMLTQVLALELAAEGIRVNAVCPGMVEDTGLGDAAFSREQVAASYDRFRPLHPLGRNGRPTDVADAVLFLAGPASSWITGAIIPLDGGRLLTTNRPT